MSSNKIPAVLYHYCNADAFVNIIQESSFRLSNVLKSNDKDEVVRIQPKICKSLIQAVKNFPDDFDEHITDESIIKLVEGRVTDFNKNLYVVCFSEESDLLSNWEMYADKGKGFAIGVNTNFFSKLQNNYSSHLNFDKVCYDESINPKVKEYMHTLIRGYDGRFNLSAMEDIIFKTTNYILSDAIFYKNSKFSSEKEWRLVLNPLSGIKNLRKEEDYYDKIREIEQYNANVADGFCIGEVNVRVGTNKNTITSFYPLNFGNIKTNFIREIAIGPNMKLNTYDFDLRLFLHKYGYKISPQKTSDSVLIKKSIIPYQSF